jgi:hypothetical protein
MSQPIYFVTVENNTKKAKETFGTVLQVGCCVLTLIQVANLCRISRMIMILSILRIARVRIKFRHAVEFHLADNLAQLSPVSRPFLSPWSSLPRFLCVLSVLSKTHAEIMQITASDFFEEEQEEVRETARRLLPDIHLIMVPPGLYKQEGETKAIEYLTDQVTESRLSTKI